jgi:hypothetical protein
MKKISKALEGKNFVIPKGSNRDVDRDVDLL